MSEIRSFRDLAVWQRGVDLSVMIYELTRSFPKQETYGLCSQMQRAATSVPANIAEGRGRSSTKDFLRYLSIACGSLAELATFIVIGQRLNYINATEAKRLDDDISTITRMIHGLQRSLRKRIPKPCPPNPKS